MPTPRKKASAASVPPSLEVAVSTKRAGRGQAQRAEIEKVIADVEAMRIKQGFASSQEVLDDSQE